MVDDIVGLKSRRPIGRRYFSVRYTRIELSIRDWEKGHWQGQGTQIIFKYIE